MSAPIAVAAVAGLSVQLDFVSEDEERALLAAIDDEPWSLALQRRTQHYGFKYDYRTRTLPERLGALPAWSDAVVARLAATPNQLIVNEYTPGQGIAPHVDSAVFGSPIVSLSLGASWPMDFSRAGRQTLSIVLPRRSALMLDGEARSVWRHSIASRRSDVVRGATVPRTERRVSLTFRIVDVP